MKRSLVIFAAAVVAASMCVVLAGCGEKMPYDGLNLDDYVKLGEYKGLKLDADYDKVTQADIDEKIDSALTQAGKETDLKKGDTIKDGDTTNIDFVGKKDGKEFEGGTAQGHELVIGSNSFIPGFEDGLIGKKVGDKVSLPLTFPEDYQSEELAGQDVVFDVTINSAKRTVKPEYNDEFVKSNTTYKTTAEYEKSLEKTIKEEKTNEQKSKLWSEVAEASEVKKYPEDQVKKIQGGYKNQFNMMAEQSGMEKSQLYAQYGASDGATMNQILKEQAEGKIKQEMIIQDIADKEKITYTDKEMDKELETAKESLESQGYSEEQYEELTGRTMTQDLHFDLLMQKVMDMVMENAKAAGK